MKWSRLDGIALRAPASSTFRAPITAFAESRFERTNQQFTNPLGGQLYRTVYLYGNPDLKPETANTYNVGSLFELGDAPVIGGSVQASLDYFNFTAKDEIAIEAAGSLSSTMLPNATRANWRCGNAQLVARFTFVGGVCNPNKLLALQTNRINTAGVDLSGLDFSMTWETLAAPLFLSADFTVAIDGSYLFAYSRAALVTVEGIQIATPIDRVGKYDLLRQFFSYPEVCGNVLLNWA